MGYIIWIISSCPADLYSEKIVFIRVTYDPPVSIMVNKYLKSRSFSLSLLVPYFFYEPVGIFLTTSWIYNQDNYTQMSDKVKLLPMKYSPPLITSLCSSWSRVNRRGSSLHFFGSVMRSWITSTISSACMDLLPVRPTRGFWILLECWEAEPESFFLGEMDIWKKCGLIQPPALLGLRRGSWSNKGVESLCLSKRNHSKTQSSEFLNFSYILTETPYTYIGLMSRVISTP